jgi:signal transduction histidine kinase
MNEIIQDNQIQDARIVDLAKNAERHSRKLRLLVDDLLITTILPHEELELHKSLFSFAELIEGCCYHIQMSGTHTLEKTGDQSITMFADQQKVDHVRINLLNNAIKYAPDSKVINIGVEQIDNHTKVSIRDQGIGIASEDKIAIFERFKKIDNGQHSQSGLGLGLYISSEIVKRHGGKIGVDSIPGQGSSFWFTLPSAA